MRDAAAELDAGVAFAGVALPDACLRLLSGEFALLSLVWLCGGRECGCGGGGSECVERTKWNADRRKQDPLRYHDCRFWTSCLEKQEREDCQAGSCC